MGNQNSASQTTTVIMCADAAELTFPGVTEVFDIQDKEIEIENRRLTFLGYIAKAMDLLPTTDGTNVTSVLGLCKYALNYIATHQEIDRDQIDRIIRSHISKQLYSQISAEFIEIKKKLESIELLSRDQQYADMSYCISRCGVLLELFLSNLQNALCMAMLFKDFCVAYISLGLAMVKFDKVQKRLIIGRFNEIQNAVNKFKEETVKQRKDMVKSQHSVTDQNCYFIDTLRDNIRSNGFSYPDGVSLEYATWMFKTVCKEQKEYQDRLELIYERYFDRIVTDALEPAKRIVYAEGEWKVTRNMNYSRYEHTASVLTNGKVLVAGGRNAGDTLKSTELYDPSTGVWTVTGNMYYTRSSHTASVLTNGKVLVTGGYYGAYLKSAELYDPSTGVWTVTGNMNYTRSSHTASVLTSGKVLVTGGYDGVSYLNSAELYDPSTGVWTITGNMNYTRRSHTASVLTSGKVLVTGGYYGAYLNSAELYDPSTGVWTVTGNMNYTRRSHTASVLTNGKVLVTGGYDGVSYLNSAELYNPSTGMWTVTGNMNYTRRFHTASVSANGKVLVTGGETNLRSYLNSTELYDPSTGVWTGTEYMNYTRHFHTASVLANGKVLVTGGKTDVYIDLNSTELYQP